jgi:hypothetical protein
VNASDFRKRRGIRGEEDEVVVEVYSRGGNNRRGEEEE